MSGVQYLDETGDYAEKEAVYLRVRREEQRLLPDAQVVHLPRVPMDSQHVREWAIRAHSLERFLTYAKKRFETARILDLGCGNGWMSARLAGLPGAFVTGMDLNSQELEQASRLFGALENLEFVFGDINKVRGGDYDLVVLASAIQYFGEPEDLLNRLLRLLRPGGEIHIWDSPIYHKEEVDSARLRSHAYYKDMGQESMSRYYHHHDWSRLEAFNPKIMADPKSVWSRFQRRVLRRAVSPFPWIGIRKPDQ